MNNPSTHEKDDKERIVEKAEHSQSSVDKLSIGDETFDANDDIDSKRKHPLVTTRTLPKEATTYELETFDKHALVIFNQKEIDGCQSMLGTEKDVEALTSTFNNFGFEVTSHDNLTKDVLFEEFKKFSQRDFTDYGCVAIAILTHGSNNGMLRAKDQLYSEIEVINQFKNYSNPTLVTKPKIFIIQASRGPKIGAGIPVFQTGKIREDFDAKELGPYYVLPLESDMLVLHSSSPGCVSHRDEMYGSWFIQTLCKKIDTLSLTQDLESIITEVKRDVAINKQHEEFNQRTFEMQVSKQMPVVTSTLIRKLYLKKFGERALEETYVDKSKLHCESRLAVQDVVRRSLRTPLPVQFEPYSSFLEHYTYMTNCLRQFVEQNPDDETAQGMLALADLYEDSDLINKSKEKLCNVISKYLMDKAQDSRG